MTGCTGVDIIPEEDKSTLDTTAQEVEQEVQDEGEAGQVKKGRRKKAAAEGEEQPRRRARKGAEATDQVADEPDPAAANAAEGEFTLKYDVSSKERYVDSTSQKTEFEKMLDELSRISRDMLDWEVEKFTRRYQGDQGEDDATAKKFEAFLGGFITNAAMELYDRGYQDAAFQRLEQTLKVMDAKRKLESEVESIKARQEEDTVDLSDMLGLFGDGDDDDA